MIATLMAVLLAASAQSNFSVAVTVVRPKVVKPIVIIQGNVRTVIY